MIYVSSHVALKRNSPKIENILFDKTIQLEKSPMNFVLKANSSNLIK